MLVESSRLLTTLQPLQVRTMPFEGCSPVIRGGDNDA